MKRFILTLIIALSLCGCVHYHLGQANRLPFRSIHVAPLRNETLLSQIQATLWKQIIEELFRSPQLTIESRADRADAVLEITILDSQQEISATANCDSLRAESYTVNLLANCSLNNRRSGEYFFENRRANATINWRTQQNFIASKQQSLPELTRELAMQIANLILNFQP